MPPLMPLFDAALMPFRHYFRYYDYAGGTYAIAFITVYNIYIECRRHDMPLLMLLLAATPAAAAAMMPLRRRY